MLSIIGKQALNDTSSFWLSSPLGEGLGVGFLGIPSPHPLLLFPATAPFRYFLGIGPWMGRATSMDGISSMRRLNYKLFLGLVGGLVLLVAVTFLVHWLQTGSIARALLARANRAEQQDNLPDVARYVSRYLELEPDNVEERARLGRILADERLARSPNSRRRAIFVIEQVLLKQPERHDLRLRLARVALDLERPELAKGHLDILQKSLPDHGELESLLGRWAEAEKKWAVAEQWYVKAVAHAPDRWDTFVRLADLYRRRFGPDKDGKQAARADAAIDEMVRKNAANASAHLARWEYRKQWHAKDAQESAGDNVREALRLAPEEAEPLLAGAELAQMRKDVAAARQHLRLGQQRFPNDPRLVRELALLELREKNRDEALKLLRETTKHLTGAAQSELLWTLANVLLDGGKDEEVNEARALIPRMAKAGAAPASSDYLNARVLVLQGNWAEAARLLERTRAFLDASPELANQVDLYLTQCFAQLDDATSQVSAYQRVVDRPGSAVTARIGLASALAARGQLDAALANYRQAARQEGAPPMVWLETARLLVLREALRQRQTGADGQKLPPDPGAVRDIETAIQAADAKNPKSVAVAMLKAEVLVAQGKPGDAEDILRLADVDAKEKADLWAARATLAALPQGGNDPARAAKLFDEARQDVGDKIDLRVARIRFWAARIAPEMTATLKPDALAEVKKQAIEELKKLGDNLASFDKPGEQARLLGELAEANYRLGETKEASRLWTRVAQLPGQENDLRLRLVLFDLTLEAGDGPAMQRAAAEVKRVEGMQGTLWRYAEAARLIWEARQGKPEGLDEARVLLDAVATRRPEWPTAQAAKGDLEELKGNLSQAVVNYRKAVQLGERSPRVVFRLMDLLNKQQRTDEAEQVANELLKQALDPAEMQSVLKIAVGISLQNQQPGRALELMKRAVAADSKNYRDHLLLGQVMAANGRYPEAEQKLRQAVTLGGTVGETWVALTQFLASRDAKAAEKVIEEARAKLPPEAASLALAQCYEAIGKIEAADEQYRAALTARPADIAVWRGAAMFAQRVGNVKDAETRLRRIMEPDLKASPADAAWARRGLAVAIANRGGFSRFSEALTLVGLKLDPNGKVVEETAARGDDLIEELRARARVLVVPPLREARKKAVELLQDLAGRRALTPEDQFLLGQLFEFDGQWDKAKEQYRPLTAANKGPQFLGAFATGLLRRRELRDADLIITRLEQAEKTRGVAAGAFGSIELRAQWHEASGQPEKAFALLEEYVEREGSRPEKTFLLVGLLARQGRLDEALKRCARARQTCPIELVAGASVSVLRNARANAQQCLEVETWIEAERKKDPKATLLTLHLADLQDYRGDYPRVETLCRQVLKQDETNLIALNNLAQLLATRQPSSADEALALINRAIALAGPRGDLLDTRAAVRIAMNRGDLALADIEAATIDGASPARYFRLAQAQLQVKQTKEAKASLTKATAAGLKADQLHPIDRVAFLKLQSELEQK